MNGHDDSITSSSTDASPSKPLATPKGLPSMNGKHTDSPAKAKADSRSSTPRQGTQAHSDTQKALEGAVRDLRVRCISRTSSSLCSLLCPYLQPHTERICAQVLQLSSLFYDRTSLKQAGS